MKSPISVSRLRVVCGTLILATIVGAGSWLSGLCGPFADVSDVAFCPGVLEIFFLGITTGTTPTTYDPSDPVSRVQMAAFLSRTVDNSLRRRSSRAALGWFWSEKLLAVATFLGKGTAPSLVRSDGTDLWIAVFGTASIVRSRASDGRYLETWTGANNAFGVLVALGQVFATGFTDPGSLYRVDPSKPPGTVDTVANTLGGGPEGITFDGVRIWTANSGGSVSIVTPSAAIPWTVTTVATGFSGPVGALYAGDNVWITDHSGGRLLRLDVSGAILQTITTQGSPNHPAFDGENLWVPVIASDSVLVVRAKTGVILATLTGNGLGNPQDAAFDGQRVLVSDGSGVRRVSLFKAADLTAIGNFSTGFDTPFGACSDGTRFWLTMGGTNLTGDYLARF